MKNAFDDRDDKIFCGCFWACMATFVISTIFFVGFSWQVNHKIEKNYKYCLNMLTAYFASATDAEYDKAVGELRHHWIFYQYDETARELLDYLPNTSTRCPACHADSAQLNLLAVNTGELYPLADENPLGSGVMSSRGGYDEISQSRLYIIEEGDLDYTTASIRQKQDTVSLHRMKTIFCDDCIDKILSAIDGQYINTFVILAVDTKEFYPVSEDLELSNVAVYNDKEDNSVQIKYYR